METAIGNYIRTTMPFPTKHQTVYSDCRTTPKSISEVKSTKIRTTLS